MKKSLFPFVVVAAALTGCAVNNPRFVEVAPDGTRRELSVRSWALWPATQDMSRQKASLGKTFSLGQDGLGQDGGGTNAVAALREINVMLDKIRP